MTATVPTPAPAVVDRATWLRDREELRAREKAHTREGDHRGVTFAVFCGGPWGEVAPFVEFMGYRVPWYSMQGVTDEAVGGGLSDDRGLISCYLRVGDRVLTNETTHRGSRRSWRRRSCST
ncbi:hypothetical protein ACFQ8T_15370 [Isoptericola sp. NPDC056618]|uniref:hypothetical protein n=1 Tax=Isoptericola sp. NPDC056618 TaxID=3345878 RepID=UPI003692637F